MAILRWKKVRAGVYHATSPWGLYTIDGEGYGRNRWTVTYPSGDYGMVDSFGEAKAWAEQDAEERSKRSSGHATKKRSSVDPRQALLIEEAAYAVFERPGGEDLTKDDFHEEVLGLLRQSGSGVDKQINALYRHIYGQPRK